MLISIVSEPEETLEISFLSICILPLGTKSPGEWRGQGPRAARSRAGHRVRLGDSRPGAPAFKRREMAKTGVYSIFRNVTQSE